MRETVCVCVERERDEEESERGPCLCFSKLFRKVLSYSCVGLCSKGVRVVRSKCSECSKERVSLVNSECNKESCLESS